MIKIRVNGTPVGQGAIRRSPNSRASYHANKTQLMPWRDSIIHAVVDAWGGAAPWTDGVEAQAVFGFPHLKSHYKINGELRDTAPLAKITAPDLDHLQRAVGDAMAQAGAIVDDAQICSWVASKVYTQHPGLDLIIRRL